MAAVPEKTLTPGAAGYQAVYDLWVADGKAGWVENLGVGWLYRAVWPDALASQPTFVLVASGADTGEHDPLGVDKDGKADKPSSGYVYAMSTGQSSLPGSGRRRLPQDPV